MGAPEAIPLPREPTRTDLPHWQLRTMLALMQGVLRSQPSPDDLLARHPVLREAFEAAAISGLVDLTLPEALARLDARPAEALPGPLERLRQALGLSADGVGCFVLAALADTDPRLAPLVDELHGRGGRPTRATLAQVFGPQAAAAAAQALAAAACLCETSDRALAVPAGLWDLACGLAPAQGWQHRPATDLQPLDALILPPALRQRLHDAWGAPGEAVCWVLRGSAGSGRHALAGALAHAAGLGLVEATDAAHLASLGAAAALLGAMPLASFDPAPGERVTWAVPAGAPSMAAARLPRHGGLLVADRDCRRIDLEPPGAHERQQHWRAALGREPDAALLSLRVARATLHRAARAIGDAAQDMLGIAIAEVEEQGRFALDGIARRVAPAAADEILALPEAAREDFEALVARCRHRDRLAATLPAAFGQGEGVRALFKGPSGTGKTLAARHLAATLRRPLYRVDLAAAVSKYIGETERNLERVFEAAESLDIVLLLDEGDALLAGRTGVSNATDRYANLETNYLLQRLEHYDGVLVITTNAAERIDNAFARRIDITIEFPLPDAMTRLELWLAHLGSRHAVAPEHLERIALRCALAGGQIRNTALHAALLAIEQGRELGIAQLHAALEREYRKAGQHCPSLQEGS